MVNPATRHLFCFGLGYSALALARMIAGDGWRVTGTCRSADKAAALRALGFAALPFDRDRPLAAGAFSGVTHVLVSAPPDSAGDPVLDRHGGDIAELPGLAWLGYLSTTGVYGDRGGGWVDESAALRPSGERGRRRVIAEQGWLDLWRDRGVPVHIFRLAAIYGPGRSPFAALRAGTARRIDRPGQVFSRIHVEDLARVLLASIGQPRPGAVYNVCDDEPAAPEAVVAHAAAPARRAGAAADAARRGRAVADGAELLRRQQAGAKRIDQARAGRRPALSRLSRRARRDPRRRAWSLA